MPAPRPERVLPAALAAAAWIAAASLAPPARADVDDRLKEVEKALDQSRAKSEALGQEAKTLAAEAARLRAELVAVARKAQDRESEMSDLEGELATLETREAARTKALETARGRLATLLGALERLARNPPAALLAAPTSPNDTVRSAILLRAAVPELDRRAKALGAELDEIAKLRAGIAARRTRLDEAGKALAAERASLAKLVAEKGRIEDRNRAESRAEAQRTATLAARAKSLKDLLARIEAGAKARPPVRPAPAPAPAPAPHAAPPAAASGGVALPARGEITQRFGEDDHMGGRTKGIEIRTRPAAQVVAPADGTVVFAAPFHGYGRLLIIKSGAEYHALLGGLARIEAEVGQSVLAGEPVGVMQGSPDGGPVLYFELRRKGQPINPLPWLAARNSKVNG